MEAILRDFMRFVKFAYLPWGCLYCRYSSRSLEGGAFASAACDDWLLPAELLLPNASPVETRFVGESERLVLLRAFFDLGPRLINADAECCSLGRGLDVSCGDDC